ncbi:hypothetical protein CHS0354_040794 [Potamilus streckersoni]|uniref:Uncharacterized protein n=1 Tax=Potamilus streckersoni TaxID=2493646 RepID=A0AAE0SL90_9BIVA|nr:hypothetical protein CHS0354_040794 [Potamilus streckersoni]
MLTTYVKDIQNNFNCSSRVTPSNARASTSRSPIKVITKQPSCSIDDVWKEQENMDRI